ncbi:MAG: ATP-binding cassette domain-containing protein [Gemmatimonadota bacterium]
MTSRLELRGIEKRYGSVQALRGADFVVERGQLHALLGENGAGKTTLMEIAFGLTQPDCGMIVVDGVETRFRSPRGARRLKIGMVHQHFTSVNAFTVAENLALAADWPTGRRRIERRARTLMSEAGLTLDPGARVEDLSVGLKQRLEILKALSTGADLLLLDEPASVLAPTEAEELLALVRAFTQRGGSAVLITHKLDDAVRWADSVTVLRQGISVFAGPAAGQEVSQLAHLMIGPSPIREAEPTNGRQVGTPVMVTSGLRVRPSSGTGTGVRTATFEVRSGEIVGIAAVEGNGQRELLRTVAGLLSADAGSLAVHGRLAFVPEDRTTEGLIPELSLVENLVLGLGASARWIDGPWIDWAEARKKTEALIAEFNITTPSAAVPAGSLSGGNQQKLLLARALAIPIEILVIENPTRGLDFRAAAEIHAQLRRVTRRGTAVLFYSSDLDEVLALADRVIVMAGGATSVVEQGANRAEIGVLMLSAGPEKEARS